MGANSATPIENPTIISNLIELYSMMILPGACVITFGKMVRDRKKAQQAENGELDGGHYLKKPTEALLLGCTAVRAEVHFRGDGNSFS